MYIMKCNKYRQIYILRVHPSRMVLSIILLLYDDNADNFSLRYVEDSY